MDDAFKYIIDKGISTEDDYSYKGSTGKCNTSVKKSLKITSFVDVPQNSTSQMVSALNVGPVSVAIDAGSLFF